MPEYFRIISVVLVGILTLDITACAYIFHGTSDQITIQSADKDAKLYVDNILVGQGTAIYTAERNHKYTITARKAGCSDVSVQTGDKFDPVSLLGLLIDFGVISILVIDNLTGAMWKTYPTVYNVTPICG
jgi:hypothetical protein